MRNRLFGAVALLGASYLSVGGVAQMPPGPPQGGNPGGRPPSGPLQVHPLTPTVYWVSGGVGNVGIIVGDKGVIVVDTTMSQTSAKELIADIAKITPKPVNAVILTHGDMDHVGGLGAFPAGITIIAQENNKKQMEARNPMGGPSTPADHLPNHTVANREDLVLDGVKFELLHWAPAHTSGDLVVYLPAQKIVFTGDIFAMDQPRALIHLEEGGSSEGWITTARGVVALDADRFVVGHGDVQNKTTLEQRIQTAANEREQIKKLVAEGKSLPEIEAAVGDPPPGQTATGPGGPRFQPFSQVIYQELTEKK